MNTFKKRILPLLSSFMYSMRWVFLIMWFIGIKFNELFIEATVASRLSLGLVIITFILCLGVFTNKFNSIKVPAALLVIILYIILYTDTYDQPDWLLIIITNMLLISLWINENKKKLKDRFYN